MSHFRLLCVVALTAAPVLQAVETKSWIHSSQSDFQKGTLKGLSLRSDGRLMLAPATRELLDSPVAYLWALATDSQGNLYAAGGGPSATTAKIFAVDTAGKSRTLAELPGLQIQALAVDRKDQLFAATVPDGKVYRVAADGKSEVFYDPKAKYIWALAFNSRGDLFVATGDQGEIHRVSPDGKGELFFGTEETHARSMVIDKSDNLLIGTEPGGLILRVSPKAEGFVLYQANKKEVNALAVDAQGVLYAAATGTKTSPAPTPAGLSAPVPIPAAPISSTGAQSTAPAKTVSVVPINSPITAVPPSANLGGGSEVYRIGTDSYPQRVWSHREDVVYAIAFDSSGRAVLGTGNKGNIYRVESELVSTLLINTSPSQVTAFVSSPKGLFATTGNIGKVIRLGPELEAEGSYESAPLDSQFFSYWGRMWHEGTADSATLRLESRSGNLDRPQKNWSAWAPVDPGSSRITSPPARFLQYRALLKRGTGSSSPEVRQLGVAYMAKNVPPVIQEIDITPPNYKFSPVTSLASTPGSTLTLPPLGRTASGASAPAPSITPLGGLEGLGSSSSQSMQAARGFGGARWAVTDPNGDEMKFKLEIKGVAETTWKLLKENVKEKYLSWDSSAFADGIYVLRLTATDAPANPTELALTTQLESDRFLIDNTAPRISALAGARAGNKLNVQWKAVDTSTHVQKAQYSLDGGEWLTVLPTTKLSDAPELAYYLQLEGRPGEHTIAVRVADEYENEAVDKIVIQ